MIGSSFKIRTEKSLNKGRIDFGAKSRKSDIWDFLKISQDQWKVYRKDGYEAYRKFVGRLQLMQKIKDLSFRYSVDVDYDEIHNCDYNCEPYCRCGKIVNARLEKCPTSQDFYEIIKRKIGLKDSENLAYFCNRIYSLRGLWKLDSYCILVGGGYYGEEIEDVTLETSIAPDIEFFIDHTEDLTALQEYLLNIEYGYILDSLIGKKYTILEVPIEVIRCPNDSYLKKVDADYEIDPNVPICVCIKKETWSLVDGYHRFAKAKKDGLKMVKIVTAN